MAKATSAGIIAEMESAYREIVSMGGRRPHYIILSRQFLHARQSRQWRGRRFQFRGLHRALAGFGRG